VHDLRLAVERTILAKVQLSEVTKLVERNDVGDFGGLFGNATVDLPFRRYSVRRPSQTVLSQPEMSFLS
jgi:hypothetical protein